MKAEPAEYILYIDECGDQNLESFNPTFPIFTLCGILIRKDNVNTVNEQINKIKHEFWGEKKIILHSRDIRKCQNGFEVLFDLNVKQRFYDAINKLLGQDNIYTIVSCSILKEPYIRQFGKFNDVYGQSLSFIIERAIFFADLQSKNSMATISPIVERRGKREDKTLLNYYNQLLERGTYWISSDRMKQHMKGLDFKFKQDDIGGLQVADLIAYPITRHVLYPDTVNLSYDVISKNIFKDGDKMLGLRIHPETK